ncbi:MAG: signal transduction histidine kinase [Marivirga sp.]|jgi:signal transduction histidine kinase
MGGEHKKYKVNLFTLNFENKVIKNAFSQSFYKEDLYALRFVIGLSIAMSLAFIFVDLNRYDDPWISIAFRGGMALVLGLFAYLSLLITIDRYDYTQYYGITVCFVVIIGFYVQYHFNSNPSFDIFLSNILTVMVYVIATITGLRFKNAFIIISVAIFSYFIYIPVFNYSDIAIRQISQLVVVYLFSILSSYVLERQKINLFISRSILDEEKNKVESIGNVRNKLFSIVSHDLRSPILSLKGIVSLLNKEAVTKEEFRSLSVNLEEKLLHTSYLMDNLLAWSKSQMDGLIINKSEINIKEVVENIVNGLKLDLVKKAITIDITIKKGICLNADREMILIILRNLISNAIKFTPYDGTIQIEAFRDDISLQIFIKDNGSGISKEKLNSIFTLNKATLIGNVQAEGAGIGLLLVKEFTELNNGTVSCESSLGKGSLFILKFPTKA